MKHLLATATLLFCWSANSQMSATFTKTINTICNGGGCDYNGPSILINELMISPTAGDLDGSMSGVASPGLPPLFFRQQKEKESG